MFDFISMANNYEERKVARFELGMIIIDTCAVSDSDHPFETAISHPQFNSGNWIIVEHYDSKQEAIQGHNKWVDKITSKENFPLTLKDVSTAMIAKYMRQIDPGWDSYGRTIDGKVIRPELAQPRLEDQ
jgi:hypothetical protein